MEEAVKKLVQDRVAVDERDGVSHDELSTVAVNTPSNPARDYVILICRDAVKKTLDHRPIQVLRLVLQHEGF